MYDTNQQGTAGQGTAGLGKARLGRARQGMARRGMAWPGEAWQGKANINPTEEKMKTGKEASVKINNPTEIIDRKVKLCSINDIMFDRYAGDNSTKLEAWQKFYFQPGNSKVIGLPALNIMSFLSAHNTNSAPKRLRDKRKYKDICNACLSFVILSPAFIPFTRNGVPVEFGKFDGDVDGLSGAYVHRSVARLDKGIPNPKERPVLPAPWELCFSLKIIPNREIQEQEILNLFEEGGRALGLGTFRGVYGKFYIESWV